MLFFTLVIGLTTLNNLTLDSLIQANFTRILQLWFFLLCEILLLVIIPRKGILNLCNFILDSFNTG